MSIPKTKNKFQSAFPLFGFLCKPQLYNSWPEKYEKKALLEAELLNMELDYFAH